MRHNAAEITGTFCFRPKELALRQKQVVSGALERYAEPKRQRRRSDLANGRDRWK
jgi:hypothetical protein